jgi:hypothetical protein
LANAADQSIAKKKGETREQPSDSWNQKTLPQRQVFETGDNAAQVTCSQELQKFGCLPERFRCQSAEKPDSCRPK